MKFSSLIFFNNINHSYTSYIEEKLFVVSAILYGYGYLLLLEKGGQKDVQSNCIVPP